MRKTNSWNKGLGIGYIAKKCEECHSNYRCHASRSGISKFCSKRCLGLSNGRKRLGIIASEESRRKSRTSHLGVQRNCPAWNKGKVTSEEVKNKIRESVVRYRLNHNVVFQNVGKNEKKLLDRQEQVDKCKILRQFPLKIGYFVDGYCLETNVVYEVYESWHEKQKDRDLQRQKAIQNFLNCKFVIIRDDIE